MRVLVLGASGFVGVWTCARLRADGHEVVEASRSAGDLRVDLATPGAAAEAVTSTAAAAVVVLSAVPDITPCRDDPELARRVNAEAAGEIAEACASTGARLVHVSTDQVFDGTHGGWLEDDEARPLHEYGRTKLAGERAVLAADPRAVVPRLGLVTGRATPGCRSATTGFYAALERGDVPTMFTDEVRSPVAVADVALALSDLCSHGDVAGVVHLGGPEALTRHALALREAVQGGYGAEGVGVTTRVAVGLADVRPGNLKLGTKHDARDVFPRAHERRACRVDALSGEPHPLAPHIDSAGPALVG